MLITKIKTAGLSLVSVLCFSCSANNAMTVPVSQLDVTESGLSNFAAKAAPFAQQNMESGQPKPAGSRKPKPLAPPNADCKESGKPEMNGKKPPAPPAGSPKPRPYGSGQMPNTSPVVIASPNSANFAVTISGGYETDSRDNGRPVVLIASALGVPSEVFRSAFSLVTPANGGQEPEPAQVAINKSALLSVLGAYGVTNDSLDTVSNYYRYLASAGQVWARTPATATAIVSDGVVTGIQITNPGSGYSSTPTIKIAGATGITATATVAFTKDFATNGSISAITLSK